jgi:hypothetical protein
LARRGDSGFGIRDSKNAFTQRERRLVGDLRTPRQVQAYLNAFPYNQEPHGRATLRSFRGVVREGCAHCLEAALFAATVLEAHGYPPLLLSFESIDQLDHVIFVYRQRGTWGSIARSRDPGLHGRKPVFATPRALALSYVDPYIDFTGRVTGYAVVDLRELMGEYEWRLADTNVWKVERALLDLPHRRIASSDRRVDAMRARYRAFRAEFPGRKPIFYRNRARWMPLPAEFLKG